MPTTLEQINQQISNLLGTRATLLATLPSAQTNLNQRQHLASQIWADVFPMQNRQNISRGRMLVKLSIDHLFAMDNGHNLFSYIEALVGQEFEDYSNFKYDYQGYLNEAWNIVNGLNENDADAFDNFISNFQDTLQNGLYTLESLYESYAGQGNPQFYAFAARFNYHWGLLLLMARTLPGCQGCIFTPVWYSVAFAVDFLQDFRNGLSQRRDYFDSGTYDYLDNFVINQQGDLYSIADGINFDNPTTEIAGTLLYPLQGWLEGFAGFILEKRDEFGERAELYTFFQGAYERFYRLFKYAAYLDLNDFLPAEPEAYRNYIYRTLDLTIQHYMCQYGNLLYLAAGNSMELGDEPRSNLMSLLQAKLSTLAGLWNDLRADDNNGLSYIRESYLIELKAIEAEVNAFFADLQFNSAEGQWMDAFLFAGIEGLRLSHFEYLTEFVNVLEGVQLHAAQRQLSGLEDEVNFYAGEVASLSASLASVNDQLEYYPQYKIQSFREQLPVLLTPVRLETKFVHDSTASKYYLCVRIFPDQFLINSHEEELSAPEIQAGQAYWRESLKLASGQASGRKFHHLEAWRPLVLAYGANRAAWIVKALQPTNYATILAAETGAIPDPLFPNLTTKNGAWTKAATAYALPEKFVASLYKKNIDQNTVGVTGSVQKKLFDKYIINRTGNHLVDFNWDMRILTTDFITMVDQQFGNPIIKDLHVSLDPASLQDGLFTEKMADTQKVGQLNMDPEIAWLTDFNAALDAGMGIRFELTPEDYVSGEFARLVVLGIRSQTTELDPAFQGIATLEHLFANHRYTDGLRIVPQGTPTNNTDSEASGFSISDERDAEASFKTELEGPLFQVVSDELLKTDGQRLSELLGINPNVFQQVRFSDSKDVSEARAMNASLWPATMGYFMEELMAPVFTADGIKSTREFFNSYVQARGPLPAFSVGSQPYGILPATRFSAWQDPNQDDDFRQNLVSTLKKLDFTWMERLNRVIKYPIQLYEVKRFLPDLDTTNILTILGLDATSSEFYHRYALGPKLFGILKQPGNDPGELLYSYKRYGNVATPPFNSPADNAMYQSFLQFADGLLAGLPASMSPRVFDFTFQEGFHKILHNFRDNPAPSEFLGDFIDRNPLSERLQLPFLGEDENGEGLNYLRWLTQASFDQIRRETFDDLNLNPDTFQAPNSLLYRMLRQAMLLAYWDTLTGLNLGWPFDRLPEKELFNTHASNKDLSRWDLLYRDLGGVPAYEHLEAGFRTGLGDGRRQATGSNADSEQFNEYVRNLLTLEGLPTARLERLLAEHLDVCNYRLDAWKTGVVTQRLVENRTQQNGLGSGIYLGAYGWLENITQKADNRDRSVRNEEGLWEDPDNMGFIHAPSLTHATTAAVLRQGYKSRQHYYDNEMPEANRMAVNLSSERTRKAQSLLEGIKTGQSLGALLGYRFEKGLYEQDLGRVVGAMRKIFPLNEALNEEPGQITAASETISARDVMDGLKLVDAYRKNGYPSGIELDNLNYLLGPGNELGDVEEEPKFIQEIDKLADAVDAVSDLVTAESIYQSVQGNYEAANASLESIAKGKVPAAPEVIRTPRTGTSLTHRVILQLGTDYNQGKWEEYDPNYIIPDSPLSQAEPALNSWLARLLGDPGEIAASVSFTFSPAGVAPISDTTTFTLAELQLQPLNLYYLLDEQALAPDTAFDTLMRRTIAQKLRLAESYTEDVPVAMVIDYRYRPASGKSVAEVLTLLSQVRNMLGNSRPVNAADLTFSQDHNPNDPNSEGYIMQDLIDRFNSLKNDITDRRDSFNGIGLTTTSADLLHMLAAAVPLNVREAVVGANAPSQADLLERASLVQQILAERLTTAEDLIANTALTFNTYAEAFKQLLGGGFTVVPKISLAAPAAGDLTAAVSYSPTLVSRIVNGGPMAMEEWLQGIATVREKLDALEKLTLLADLYSPNPYSPDLNLMPVQLPLRKVQNQVDDYWVGAEYPGEGRDAYVPEGDKLSLVMMVPPVFNSTDPMAGLVLDEWNEIIPSKTETTAVAFHFDQPNTEAPQSLLLAVSPTIGNYWSWENLLGTVNETLDMAKKRVVDSDSLAYTHLAPLLPAVTAPVAEFATTITLDYKGTTSLEHYAEKLLDPNP